MRFLVQIGIVRALMLTSMVLVGVTSCLQKQKNASLVTTADTFPAQRTNKNNAGALLQYWDNFDFEDSNAINNPAIAEQAFVDFLAAAARVPDSLSSMAIKNMLTRAKSHTHALEYFTQQSEHYLYDPNSPMRSDALYEPVLEFLLDSTRLNDASKFRFQERLRMAQKNKAGQPALDFDFELPTGKKTSLYAIKGAFTMLIFYEPDCPHCQSTLADLKASQPFQQLVAKARLKILTVYAGGSERLWSDYQAQIPASWTNGFDRANSIRQQQLYDLRGSPTIYLLDKDKRVILKDTNLNQVALLLT